MFLSKNKIYFISICFVPLSRSIDFEVFGHLHNLGWYSVLTINLLFFILHKISEDIIQKIINIKILI